MALRLKLTTPGHSKGQIAEQTGFPRNTLKKYLKQVSDNKLSFEEISTISDKALKDLFVKPPDSSVNEKLQTLFDLFPSLNKDSLNKELKKNA